MKEHIYTIPINEEFRKFDGCPVCGLYAMLEANEVDTITGAAMMEPSVRVQTNRHGFCGKHFKMVFDHGKKLPVALTVETHLDSLYSEIFGEGKAEKQAERVKESLKRCYICGRVDRVMESMYENILWLYENDVEFREVFAEQQFFCLEHYGELLLRAKKTLSKKMFNEFFAAAERLESRYLNTLKGDVEWFCKKFDYRFREESWKNSKDSVERAITFITGEKIKKKSEEAEE